MGLSKLMSGIKVKSNKGFANNKWIDTENSQIIERMKPQLNIDKYVFL